MTPKETAIEILGKFYDLDLMELTHERDGILVGTKSIKCALIAVDLKMEDLTTNYEADYWGKVKNELQKLTN